MSQFAQRDQDHDNAINDRNADAGAARAPGRRTRTEGLTRRGGGQPLPGALRAELEPAIGSDLGDVRLHTGPDAAADAKQLDARAFAIGQDVHFGAGQYTPESAEGRHLIAHEVAHTVQQRGAPEAPACAPLEVSQPGDRWEAEADAFADAFGNLAPHTVSPGSAASVARVHLTPNGKPAPKAKPAAGDKKNANDPIGDSIRLAKTELVNAMVPIPLYAEIVDLLVATEVQGVAQQTQESDSLKLLRKAIEEKGRPNILHMVIDLTIGVVSLATGIGELAEAAGALAVIAGGADLAETGNGLAQASEGGDIAVDQKVADHITMLGQHLEQLNASLITTDSLMAALSAVMIVTSLHTAATLAENAALGMARGGGKLEHKTAMTGIVKDTRTITTEMTRLNALLATGAQVGFEKIATGTQARTLIEFLTEREKAGELGQITLRRPQKDVVVGGFQWGGTPKRPVSGFHFSQFSGRFGHRIDGGKKWLPQLLTFGLIPNGTNPESPTELTLEDKMAEAVMMAFSGLGVKEEAPSKVHVNLPSGTIELPIGSSQFWEDPKFGELYDRELQHPEGYRVYALYVQYPDGAIEQHQPHWLTARLDEDND